MLKELIFIFSAAISLTSGEVLAKGPSSLRCADLLAPVVGPVASPFDYTVSDFEGLYTDILRDVALWDQIPENSQRKWAEDFLKKKATFLNQAIYVVYQMKMNEAQGLKSPLSTDQIINMIASLGVDPNEYIPQQNTKSSEPSSEARSENKPTPANAKAPEAGREQQGFMGFINPKGSNERDLPDHLTRAIGFGRTGITRDKAPERQTGLLQFKFDEKTQILFVTDVSERTQYIVSIQMLASNMIQTDDKIMELAFNQEQTEWFISFENTANPNGTFGFATPKK